MNSETIVCRLCGSHFPGATPPAACPICLDVRGIGRTPKGEHFTTLGALCSTHQCVVQEEAPDLTGIGVMPGISAGQRALLVQTPEGNVLWDCLPILDDTAVEAVRDRGGLAAIAISHPHFYGAMVEWSRAFDDAPIYVNAADRQWVTHPDPSIVYWEGDTQSLVGGITLVHCAGHFDGAALLHWPAGAEGRGALLTGDPMSVTPDRHVSFMYAYPNLLPLAASAVRSVVKSVESFAFDRIYGGWFGTRIQRDAKDVLARSAQRYIAALEG
jgi:glyoxylase-like metal-dependent hydrolase (beta-lactamase superfamily II)